MRPRTADAMRLLALLSSLAATRGFQSPLPAPRPRIRAPPPLPRPARGAGIVATAATEPGAAPPPLLPPVPSWAYARLEEAYARALAVKCPFFRRRAADALDGAEQVLRFLLARHRSLPAVGVPPPPLAWRCTSEEGCTPKEPGLDAHEAREVIRADWRPDTGRGYYITGRLRTSLYRDDCTFDGPDPDMPVRGLRKYLNAASQLFDPARSRAELLALDVVEVEEDQGPAQGTTTAVVVARWRMTGVLRLPWKPRLPTWTGTTTYHFDADGLVHRHVETWDMSVPEAFARTLWPAAADRVWGAAPGAPCEPRTAGDPTESLA